MEPSSEAPTRAAIAVFPDRAVAIVRTGRIRGAGINRLDHEGSRDEQGSHGTKGKSLHHVLLMSKERAR